MTEKLVYILNEYSEVSNSHFYHILNLLEVIAKKGVEVSLIIEKCNSKPFVKSNNIRLFPIQESNKIIRSVKLVLLLIKLSKNGYKKVFIRITSITAGICIVTSWFTKQKTYYWLSGTVLEQYYDLPFGCKKLKNYFKSRLPYYFVKNKIDYFITGPESMVNYYVEIGNVKREKIILLYNDIDLSRFYNVDQCDVERIRVEYCIPEHHKIGLFVHRFSPVRKSNMYLPKIFDYFFNVEKDSFTFLLVGSGPEKKEIERQISLKKYKKNIKFIGSIPNKDIQILYNSASIFINPTYAEGFPRVLLEAMASGLPIVTTDAGGIKDILGPKQKKFMVSKIDVEGFSEKMVELASKKDIQNLLKEENLDIVQKYSTDKVARMYIDKLFNN